MFYIGELRDSSMVRYTIAPNKRFLCASPKYLREQGVPSAPEDLTRHRCIALRENNEDLSLWKFARGKATRNVRIDPVLVSNNGEVVRQWTVQGKGIAIRSEWDAADFLQSKKLVQLLPESKIPPADVVALVPQRRGMSARAKTFIEFVMQHIGRTPPWRSGKEN